VGGGLDNFVGAPSGDRTVTASSASSGGAAIDISSNSPSASVTPTVHIYIGNGGTGPTLTGGSISVTTDVNALVKAIAKTTGGGAITLGNSQGTANVDVTNTIEVKSNSSLTSTGHGNLTIEAYSNLNGISSANTNKVGFIGFVKSRSRVDADYETKTVINGTLTAGETLFVGAKTVVDTYSEARSEAGGLGADADSNDDGENWGARIGRSQGDTLVDIQGSGNLHGNIVQVMSQVPSVKATAISRTRATALGADSDAGANAEITASEVRLNTDSYITGMVRLDQVALAQDRRLVQSRPPVVVAVVTPTRAYVRIDTNSKVAGSIFAGRDITPRRPDLLRVPLRRQC
jgi:hypothetical protein